MATQHIIIVGAGASGLMAAMHLGRAGFAVTVLEARSRVGGRIHTIYDGPFATHLEMGAEFVHGDLPVSLALLKEAGIKTITATGEMWQLRDEGPEQDEHIIEHWKQFSQEIEKLEEDMTLDEFLTKHFSDDKYASLRESARRYAAGYDTADPAKASAMALGEEWEDEDDADQYRPAGGYGHMINYLISECKTNNVALHTDAVVKDISWSEGSVTVTTTDAGTHTGSKVIITVPVGVLQASKGIGSISFSPALPVVKDAVQNMGMGAIIKILIQFTEAFWKNKDTAERIGKDFSHMAFVLSKEAVPTWWTQYPEHNSLLTGWLGGPPAARLQDATDEQILEMSIQSLAGIFKTSVTEIRSLIATWKIVNWTTDPYSRGSYSYATVQTNTAREQLAKPVANTIFFAGEAMYDGPEMGTVEAALSSGKEVAENIIAGL